MHISLHAGELAAGLVPPEGLRFHIRQAVELAHAERIGHGVDVMYEDNAPGLLKELAQKHVMVEINLSSNEGILGIEGDEHPFPYYRAAHVPVALSTDDEGVSRIDITHEYVRAALDYHLTYEDLKTAGADRHGTQFLPGASLWASRTMLEYSGACKGETRASEPSPPARRFLTAARRPPPSGSWNAGFGSSRRNGENAAQPSVTESGREFGLDTLALAGELRSLFRLTLRMDNERIREICMALPHAAETLNWGHHLVYWAGDRDIGGKMFAMTDLDGTGIGVLWFHCGAERFHELLESEGISRRRTWPGHSGWPGALGCAAAARD